MYKIIYMKADYEPWWLFEGWEEHIISIEEFDNEQQFYDALNETLQNFRQTYANEQCKNDRFYAFWSEEECEYCEACDDDSQIYHGIIAMLPNRITS